MRLTAAGITKADADLRAMVDRVRNLKSAMDAGANDIRTLIDTAFRNSQDPSTGKAWDSLAQSTIDKRRKSSSKPLVDTGRLRGSVTTEATNKTISYGTNVEYAGFHQFGTKHIPMRAFMPTAFDPNTPAGKTIERIRNRIRNFILTGESKA